MRSLRVLEDRLKVSSSSESIWDCATMAATGVFLGRVGREGMPMADVLGRGILGTSKVLVLILVMLVEVDSSFAISSLEDEFPSDCSSISNLFGFVLFSML